MKIDIWSDIMCPFCYIGKRKLEQALAQFEHNSNVAIVWHSFQLDPDMKSQPGKDLFEYLAERKGQTRDWSVKVHGQVANTAKEAGLAYNFDKAIIANSFNAHRLIQMAKAHGLGDAAEETLFKAYFTEGKNVDDMSTLAQLGVEIGLKEAEVKQMLQCKDYEIEVANDIKEAREIGISGVPFFVLNNKYAISGAQPTEVFLDGLQQAWLDYEKGLKSENSYNDEQAVCSIDGEC